jgi:MFS superfamily sulfate permease-like transporter
VGLGLAQPTQAAVARLAGGNRDRDDHEVFDFLLGVLFGVLARCAIFVLDVSRIGVIRRQFGLDERPSLVMRSIDETRILAAHGHKVQTLELSGFIFFGSAYWLQDHVKKLVADKGPEILIFDFSAVTGVDSSVCTPICGRPTYAKSWSDCPHK